MKRIFSLILCAVFFCCAAASAEMAGMPNPMVEVTDGAEFEEQLGIAIDTSYFSESITDMFIISKSIADIRFVANGLEGEDVKCCLRATKDADVKENPATDLAGYYYDFDEPVEMEYDKYSMYVYYGEDNEGKITIYSWNYGGIYCTLAIDGELSQMRIASILDQCTGAMNMNPFE